MGRILIAEDEYLVAFVLREYVRGEGHEVVAVAKDGRQAVALCRQHAPDVVLMDMRMPGLSGVAAAAQISEQCPGARVIFVSAGPAEDLRAAAATGCVHGYLSKPVTRATLAKALCAALDPGPRPEEKTG